MKIIGSKFKLITLAALLTGFCSFGQNYEKSRTVNESFPVNPETEIEISNKYGNIHLISWEKDSVRFEIKLSVTANKESKADKTFDYIDFDFKTSKYYIVAQTVFAGKGSFWSDVSDLASTVFTSGTKTQIEYTVYLPAGNHIRIENKFGNVYTTDHTGVFDLNLSNGDFKAHSLMGESKLILDFGNANIDQINNAKLFINYSEINLDEADKLDIESKSSKFYLENMGELTIKSKRDKFYIKEVGSLIGDVSFTFFEIDQLSGNVDMKTHYGDLTIKGFSDEIEFIKLNSDYTDFNFYFDEERLYEIELLCNKKTSITYPAILLTKKETQLEEDEQIRVECKIGKLVLPSIPININTQAGSIYLKSK